MTSFCQRTRSCVHSLNSRSSTPLFAEGAAQTENSPRECPASEAKHPKSPFNPRASWLTSQFSGDVIRANQIDFFFFQQRSFSKQGVIPGLILLPQRAAFLSKTHPHCGFLPFVLMISSSLFAIHRSFKSLQTAEHHLLSQWLTIKMVLLLKRGTWTQRKAISTSDTVRFRF